MSREENLKIAKRAYKEIKNVMKRYENVYDINFCWGEFIWLEDDFFQCSDLSKEFIESQEILKKNNKENHEFTQKTNDTYTVIMRIDAS